MTDMREVEAFAQMLIDQIGTVNPYDMRVPKQPLMPDDIHGLIEARFGRDAARSLRFSITWH